MENWKFALSSVWSHKMRSFLTMLGIIIGVAAVVVIMALGNGMKKGVTSSFTKDQQDVQIYYSPVKSSESQETGPGIGLTISDDSGTTVEPPKIQEDWVKELTKLDGVENYYVANSTIANFSYQSKKADNVNITGVNSTYFQVKKYDLVAGRKISSQDYQTFSRVVMLDEGLAEKLFSTAQEALNKVVSVGNTAYRVVGVYKDPNAGTQVYGISSGGNAIMANTQVAAEFGSDEVSTVSIHVSDIQRVSEVGKAAAKELDKISGITEGEFQIFDLKATLDEINSAFAIMTTVIGSIAGISLLVGGVGVMNIMLVSVTERTREIGLRKALGATRTNILTQFLIESVVLTLIGGLIGLLLAYGIISLVGSFASGTLGGAPEVSATVAIGSMAFSAFIGILFGILPANKASKLNPIEALRYE